MKQLLSKIFITPGEARLRTGWRLLAHFLIFVLLISLFSVVFGMLAYFQPVNNSGTLLFASNLINFLAITLSVYIARGYFDRSSLSDLGLRWNIQAARELSLGIAIAAVMMSGIFVALWLSGMLTIQSFAWQTTDWGTVFSRLFDYLFIFILVGWNEELLTRGYWLQNLEQGINRPVAILLTSLVFSALHAANPNASWTSTLGLFAAGLFLAYGYTATNRLWLPIGLHIGWNFFEGVVFGFPVSGLNVFRLIEIQVSGPAWLTGAEFGPEAGLIIIPAILLGTLLIFRTTRLKVDTQVDK